MSLHDHAYCIYKFVHKRAGSTVMGNFLRVNDHVPASGVSNIKMLVVVTSDIR